MVWQQWVVITIVVLSTLSVVGRIGQGPRPTTPGVAVVAILINGALCVLVATI